MRTQWFYQRHSEACGPITFHELVALVKDGLLSEGDLVRPEYQRTWQRADVTPCLFEMAQRIPRERLLLGRAAEETVAPSVASVDGGSGPAETAENSDLQHWFQDQLAATAINGTVGEDPQAGLISSVGGPGLQDVGTVSKGLWHSVIAAATARFDARHSEQDATRRRWWLLAESASLNAALRLAFRCVVAAGVGWMTWSAMQHAEATEALRFPGWQQKTGIKVVPILGECSPAEYAFFAWDLAVVAAIVGFAGARWIEHHAKDV